MIPVHCFQPREIDDPAPQSQVYSSFRAIAKNAMSSGTSLEQILGAPDVEPSLILDASKSANSSIISQWASGVMKSYSQQLGLAVQLGAASLILKLMRVGESTFE